MSTRSRIGCARGALMMLIGLGLGIGSTTSVDAVVRGQGEVRGAAVGRAPAPIAPTERMNDSDNDRPARSERPGDSGSAHRFGPLNSPSSDRKQQSARRAGCERQVDVDIRKTTTKRKQAIGPKCRESGYSHD